LTRRAIPERLKGKGKGKRVFVWRLVVNTPLRPHLRGVFTTRRYTIQMHVYLTYQELVAHDAERTTRGIYDNTAPPIRLFD